MSLWKWNDVEMEVDLEDVDFQEKYEKAFNIMEREEKNILKQGSLSEITKSYCMLFWNLFDNIFGDGTADKLFNGKKNSGLCEQCYESFLNFCEKQIEEINKRRIKKFSKYKVKR